MVSNEGVCPGCRQRFAHDDITGLLPYPGTDREPKKRWHLHCHQKEYYLQMERQQAIRSEEEAKKWL